MAELLTSPLHDRHLALGAKTAPFGGWEMPLEYPTGVVAEHTAVRTAVGVFDVSHLGKAEVTGPGAAAYVNACLTNDLDRIGPGQAQYTLCCDDETGGVVDDLIVYRYSDERVLLVPNAANTAEVVRRLAASAPDGVKVTDLHRDLAVLAVQGPHSDEVMQALGLPVDHDYMSFVEATYADATVVVCRTGYTGERGYELIVANEAAGALWDALLAAGAEHGIAPVRSRRPRHAAHRDGLPAARAGHLPRRHPRAGADGLGGGLGQADLLGQGGARARARREAEAGCCAASWPPVAASRARA